VLRESDDKDDSYGHGTRSARRRNPQRPAATPAPLLRATTAAVLEVFGRWRAQFGSSGRGQRRLAVRGRPSL